MAWVEFDDGLGGVVGVHLIYNSVISKQDGQLLHHIYCKIHYEIDLQWSSGWSSGVLEYSAPETLSGKR